jgi:hypothetical protein
MSRHTVAQAADMLGITTGAVRNRLSRGTLRSVKEKGTVYVLLPANMSRDADRDTADTPGGMPPPDHDAQADDLREQVRYLREQLRREQDAHAEARRIIAGLVQRIPELEAPTGSTPDAPGSPQAGGGATSGGATSGGAAPEGADRPAERRSWWRRLWR